MRWTPRSLSARIIALVLLALLVSQLVSYFSFRSDREKFLRHVVIGNISERVAAAKRSLHFVDPARRNVALRALSTPNLQFRLAGTPPRCDRRDRRVEAFTREFARLLDSTPDRIRVCLGPGPAHARARPGDAVAVAARVGNGYWLVARRHLFDPTGRWAAATLRNLAITALIVIVIVIVASRRLTRPLRELALAAERFGRGEEVAPVVLRGSEEIRLLIAAFNRMRERLARFVDERTRLIAALAHDLRTPITALRLRLEFLPDDDNTRAMAATLEDMADMSEAALTFMREEAAAEAARNVDITALVDALVEDYRALSAPVAFQPGRRITLVCRPVAIRRALRNIIDNALAYGERAVIAIADSEDGVVIDIEDDGPGIDATDRDQVFDAFVRLESSRSRETGGTGLGLSIARSVVRGHGGEIQLANREAGGLRVRIRLPRPLH